MTDFRQNAQGLNKAVRALLGIIREVLFLFAPAANFCQTVTKNGGYKLHYTNFTERQNERNAKIRHTERNRSPEDLLTSKKTCPEESIYQLGTLESHASPKELFQIATEFMDEFHERFGKHVHILDWALHLDEGTPHIHERHVFDCENMGYARKDVERTKINAKKFVRYQEGAEKYSLGLTKFQELAKEAKAVYKIDKVALVNCEIFERYLETFRIA